MYKKAIILLLISFFISCKEKTKPFTYDYVEIAFKNHNECCNFVTAFMIDSLKKVYFSDVYVLDGTFRIDHTNRVCFSDSLQNKIDRLAKLIYYENIGNDYQNVVVPDDSYNGAIFCFIVMKDGIKKEYRKFPNGQNKIALLENIENLLIKDSYEIKDKQIDTFIEYN